MIEAEGYKIERHEVITDDNYVLGLYRIPSKKPNAKTVFLMHALFVTSLDYFVFGPKYSLGKFWKYEIIINSNILTLGYILANENYDIWFGNARGTQFSRKHILLDPDNSTEFWDFSFHEIGKYDLPAMIDYALTATNQSKLHYIGYSQGCTTFFLMLSLRPEYNAKIESMHAMSPALFIQDIRATFPKVFFEEANTFKVSDLQWKTC